MYPSLVLMVFNHFFLLNSLQYLKHGRFLSLESVGLLRFTISGNGRLVRQLFSNIKKESNTMFLCLKNLSHISMSYFLTQVPLCDTTVEKRR